MAKEEEKRVTLVLKMIAGTTRKPRFEDAVADISEVRNDGMPVRIRGWYFEIEDIIVSGEEN